MFKNKSGVETNLLLTTLIENSPASITVHDFDGNFLFINQRTLDLHGYSREEFLGLKLQDLDVPESSMHIKARMEELKKVGEATFEVWHFRKGGIKFPLLVNAKSGKWGGKDVILSTAIDITQQKKAEELLKERSYLFEKNNQRLAGEIAERKRVEAALRESEEIFRTLAESSPNMIFINEGGRIVYVNKRCVEMMGYTQDEFYDPQFNFMTLVAAEHWKAIQIMFQRHSSGENIPPTEYAVITKDGKRIEAMYGSRLIKYQGKPAILGVITDITERTKAEKALKASEENFRKLYTRTPAMLHSIDPDGKLLSVSDTWLDKMGYSREEVIGRRSTEFLTAASRKYALETVLPEFFRTGVGIDIPYQFVKKNGDLMDVLLSATSEKDEHGHVIHSLAIITDITSKKAAEEALKTSEERYRLLFEKASDIIFVLDVTGKVTSISPSVAEILEYNPTEIEGKFIWDAPLLIPEDENAIKARFSKINLVETGAPKYYSLHSKRGRTVILEIISKTIFKNGTPILLINFARDVTVRKTEEEKLRQIELDRQALLDKTLQISELKSNIITHTAHELKTPLTVIQGWGELLYNAKRQGKSLDSTFELEDLETIVRNAERLNYLINDFLDVGRIDSGKFEINKQDIAFNEIIENAIQAINYLAMQKSIKILTESRQTFKLSVDRRRMEQVLINILSNAIKYSPESSHVTIKTGKIATNGRKMFQVLVSDEGYGFTAEELAEVLTPFGKAYTKQEQKRAIHGTGLGLFITNHIIEQHGGKLSIISGGVNKGTQVEILLPLHISEDNL